MPSVPRSAIPACEFEEIPFQNVNIQDNFWNPRLEMNRKSAVLYQWEQLNRSGSVDNFRLTAGLMEGFRRGFFYSDSDVHKWAEAACVTLASSPETLPDLDAKLQEYINLVHKVQNLDGYIFTYNQFHFPARRWANLQIEHELYCHGHLIEAGIAHNIATGKNELLNCAKLAADRIYTDFIDKDPIYTSGHQEIEIALIRLYRYTKDTRYLQLATQILERRGYIKHFGWHFIRQALDQGGRMKSINTARKKYFQSHQGKDEPLNLTENLHNKLPRGIWLRSAANFASGKYNQQHAPMRQIRKPEGHAVRWGYYMVAIALLYQETGDKSLWEMLHRVWNEMVFKRMFFTGGVGAIPVIEGYGYDYEMHGQYAYCETCAAIATIMWDWEMSRISGNPKFDDLLEWQLYNAASVGIALDGRSYLYRNPLESDGFLGRSPWYDTPCCPSNVSRLWAQLGKFIYSASTKPGQPPEVWIHQYIGSSLSFKGSLGIESLSIAMQSELPWKGEIQIKFDMPAPLKFTLYLRRPSWACSNPKSGEKPSAVNISLGTQPLSDYSIIQSTGDSSEISANPALLAESPNKPHLACFICISREWLPSDTLKIQFPMDVIFHTAHPKDKANRGKVALSRGPIVYCFESVDNPNANVPQASIDMNSLPTAKLESSLLGGIWTIEAKDVASNPLLAIPYYCWANRGKSSMQVWINQQK